MSVFIFFLVQDFHEPEILAVLTHLEKFFQSYEFQLDYSRYLSTNRFDPQKAFAGMMLVASFRKSNLLVECQKYDLNAGGHAS